jgi:hypothetical protein
MLSRLHDLAAAQVSRLYSPAFTACQKASQSTIHDDCRAAKQRHINRLDNSTITEPASYQSSFSNKLVLDRMLSPLSGDWPLRRVIAGSSPHNISQEMGASQTMSSRAVLLPQRRRHSESQRPNLRPYMVTESKKRRAPTDTNVAACAVEQARPHLMLNKRRAALVR